jgi:paraquat-inducible protein A
MPATPDALGACPDCGLLQTLAEIDAAALISCGRCGATLRQARTSSIELCAVCAALGLALFGLAFFAPTAEVWMRGGRSARGDLLLGPESLSAAGAWDLAVAVVFTLLASPCFKFAAVLGMAVGVWLGKTPRWLKAAFAYAPRVSEWAMIDVFLLGAMIALFRLRAWMTVTYGPALFALAGAALCSIAIDAALDKAAFWQRVAVPTPPGRSAEPQTLIGCEHCGLVGPAEDGDRCARCERPLHGRKHDSVQRSWGLVLTAAFLAIPANVLPVMNITKLGRGGSSTILHGTVELARAGLWGLAIVVFCASIVVPLVKLTGLSLLLVSTARGSASRLLLRTRAFRVIALIGRWSMVDIFATMTLVMLARFGWLGSVMPRLGASAFCGVVFFTMLASEAFDPRLMWDAAGMNAQPSTPGSEHA